MDREEIISRLITFDDDAGDTSTGFVDIGSGPDTIAEYFKEHKSEICDWWIDSENNIPEIKDNIIMLCDAYSMGPVSVKGLSLFLKRFPYIRVALCYGDELVYDDIRDPYELLYVLRKIVWCVNTWPHKPGDVRFTDIFQIAEENHNRSKFWEIIYKGLKDGQ